MLFTSLDFFILLGITFFLYYIPFLKKKQLLLLIIASLVFYAYNEPWLTLLLLFSASVNIITSYLVVCKNIQKAKTITACGVAVNLIILAFFKYGPLISTTFFDTSGSIGQFLIKLPLPIGISFFTFEGISLVVDVWRDKKRNEDHDTIVSKSIIEHTQRTLFFISFFPHLIAGPILKAHDFYPQMKMKFFKDIEWESAFKALVTGYFLKMVVADNLTNFTFWITYPYFEYLNSFNLCIIVFGYSIQIFADFAGYSLIAIGLAKLFGYNFQTNFNFPFISTSFKEFWKRWHISLSSFLMQYLYIPLGGNRKGKVRTYFNLLLTMVLGGLWHGGAWSYALWGAFHGSLLAIERLINDNTTIKLPKSLVFVKGIFVFSMVAAAFLLFKLPDFSHVIKYVHAIYNNTGIYLNPKISFYVILYSLPVFIYHMLYLIRDKKGGIFIKRFGYIFYAVMLFLILTNSGIGGDFIYFQF